VVLPPPPPVVVVDVGVLVVAAVVVVDEAALAIAAPPPASAPVTASVVSKGFNRPMFHLLSESGSPLTITGTGLRAVGGE
jgi:hypothetical protein